MSSKNLLSIRSNSIRIVCLTLVVAGLTGLVCVESSAATIEVGQHVLLRDAPGQAIAIAVSGGELVSGIDLYVQIGDGGSELAALGLGLPPGTDGPTITDVNLTNGTIFEGVTDLPTDIGSPLLDQVAMRTLALVGSIRSVLVDGILAMLEIDSTGFQLGTWDLKVRGVLPFAELNGPFDTVFADLASPVIMDGSITLAAPGDFNASGSVDDDDFLIWQSSFGMARGAEFMDGDADIDGDVDGYDFLAWQNQFGNGGGGDYDGDEDVDGIDFLKWQRSESPNPLSASDLADWEANYGMAAPLMAASTAVPEPTTAMMLLGIVAMLFRRDVVAHLAVVAVAESQKLSALTKGR